MKQNYFKHIVMLCLCMLTGSSAFAYDAKIDGIYYNLSGDSAEVTYKYLNQASHNYESDYAGDVIIPQTVTFNDTTYKVTRIGDHAFEDCNGLKSVTIPEGVTSIGKYAFEECTNLTSVTIPESVTSIELGAFRKCFSMTSIAIPEGVTSIGHSAFEYCSGLTTVTIPKGVTSIGNDAFVKCRNLASVIILASETSIGNRAFFDCTNLTSITIPESVSSIDSYAFENTAWYDNQPDGLVYAGNVAYKYKGTMPENTSIVIKEGTKGIAGGAFQNCSNLTSISMPEGVITIVWNAFYGCSNLKSINLPESLTTIGQTAFYGCSSLTSITIPKSMTSIGYDAFASCSGLASVAVAAGNSTFDSRNNCNAVIETATNTLTVGCKNTVIPNGVTSIGMSAFHGCSDLTSIDIPASVTNIDIGAFYGCSSLTSITIPEGVTSIGNFAFQSCTAMTSITIPDGLTSIGAYAFDETAWYDNQPDGLVYARKVAYKYKGTMPENTSIVIKEGTKGIAGGAFQSCINLTSVTIPEGIVTIGQTAFYGCSSLTSIIIPKSVVNIGTETFSSCNQMKDFYCNPVTPPITDKYLFGQLDISNATLHVPAAAIEVYSSTIPWSGFGSIVADETAIGTIKGNQNEQNEDVLYDLNGRKLSKLQRGINIVRDSDGSAKKVLAR